MSRELIRLCMLAILGELLLFAGHTQAQRRITVLQPGPYTIHTVGRFEVGIAIENHTSEDITLEAFTYGDPDIGAFTRGVIPADSIDSITLWYDPELFDISQAKLVIRDSIFSSDTFNVDGYEDTYIHTRRRWTVSDSSYYFINEFGEPETRTVTVRNLGTDTITVKITEDPASYGFRMDGENPLTLVPGEGKTVTFVYLWENNPKAEAHYIFTDGFRTKHLYLHGVGHFYGDSLHIPPVNVGNVSEGDTICLDAWIYNHGDSTAIIDTMYQYYGPRFSSPGMPAFPIVIAPHDSVSVPICFVGAVPGRTEIGIFPIVHRFAGRDSIFYKDLVTYGSGTACFSLAQGVLHFGPLDSGTYEEQVITIRNVSADPIQVTSIVKSSFGAFSCDTPMPITIGPGDSAQAAIRFTAEGGPRHHGFMRVNVAGCEAQTIETLGAIADATLPPSHRFDMHGDQGKALRFSAAQGLQHVSYSFRNDLSDSITVTHVSLGFGAPLHILSTWPGFIPIRLGPGDEMIVTLEHYGVDAPIEDTLIIITQTGIVGLRYPIHGVIGPLSVAGAARPMPRIMITPNPADRLMSVEVGSGTLASFEVLDLLGRVIYRSNWSHTWDCSWAPAGTYIVRVTGLDEANDTFISTEQLILE